MSKAAIKVENLGKKFEIGHQVQGDLRASLMGKIQRLLGKAATSKEDFWALKDVSFEIKQGEAVGIIGRNGAGKSTLLKILSRITEPTTGRFEINGRVSSLLEVGTGFHPELTGRENIYLNGTILGMKRQEIKTKFDEIVEFSGVEKFIDTPVKHFSSGMKVRLAFSVAAHLEPEILIIDEVLAVGDAEFQNKCLGKMDDVSKNDGRTVLFVSHNMGAIMQLCSKAIIFNNGSIQSSGSPKEIISDYLKGFSSEKLILDRKANDKEVFIKKAVPFKSNGEYGLEFKHNDVINFEFEIVSKTLDEKYRLLVIVLDETKKRVFASETNLKSTKAQLSIEKETLARGKYSIMCIIYIPGVTQYDSIEDCCEFSVVDGGSPLFHLENFDYGTVFAKTKWNFLNESK